MTAQAKKPRHPCFERACAGDAGRIHLPVAAKCNVQCRFCNRKYSCLNECRPGVTSAVLAPHQVPVYLDKALKKRPNITVAGIAGPGDAFATPHETLETLRLIRVHFPELILCVSSNGLNVAPYAAEIAAAGVTHFTITINAVDPSIGTRLYAWIRNGVHVMHKEKAAARLLECQLEALARLKEQGITVKINTIVIPEGNDRHVPDVARVVAEHGADVMNCIAVCPAPGSDFENMVEPDVTLMARVRASAQEFMPQMLHCARCRADAVGLLGEALAREDAAELKACTRILPGTEQPRPYIAVASMEGILVNQHLGEADRLHIYAKENGSFRLVGMRATPAAGGGDARWHALGTMLSDCRALLVSGIGSKPRTALESSGVSVLEMECLISDALPVVFNGSDARPLLKRTQTRCGLTCSGTGAGCG